MLYVFSQKRQKDKKTKDAYTTNKVIAGLVGFNSRFNSLKPAIRFPKLGKDPFQAHLKEKKNILKIFVKIFGGVKYFYYLCTRIQNESEVKRETSQSGPTEYPLTTYHSPLTSNSCGRWRPDAVRRMNLII